MEACELNCPINQAEKEQKAKTGNALQKIGLRFE
jgi:hypothetical protein